MARPNTAPIFPAQYGRVRGQVSDANTAFDGSGTIVELLECPAAEPNGYLIRKLHIKAEATTTSGQIKYYLSPDAGSTWHPWIAQLVSAVTAAAGVATFEDFLDDQNDEELAGGVVLPSGWSLGASTHVGEVFEIHVEYGVL
jgi:hypothetical protein